MEPLWTVSVAQIDESLAALRISLSLEELRSLDAIPVPDWGSPYEFIGRREPW